MTVALKSKIPTSTSTSIFDAHFGLRLGLHACFGHRQLLWASIQFRGNLGLQASKVFDCFSLRHRALTRASGFPLCLGTVAIVILNFVCNSRCSRVLDHLNWSTEAAVKQHPGLKQEFGSFRHYYPFLRHYYIIFTCYDSNSVITYLYITITSLLCINTPVITSLLPVITVIMNYYYLL